jgi:hypothetical protein
MASKLSRRRRASERRLETSGVAGRAGHGTAIPPKTNLKIFYFLLNNNTFFNIQLKIKSTTD